MGNPPGFAVRKASLAVALAEVAQSAPDERDALCFAGLLHACGAIGSAAFRKGESLSDREARMERWDVPARGAHFCELTGVLPDATSDMVRWQSECWDGTGFPDQLRWHGIPPTAQFLALADIFLRAADPEEALATIGLESGRAFGPDHARAFTTWFHQNAGEVQERPIPVDALADGDSARALLDTMADNIDEHNGVPGRWRRLAELGEGAAVALGIDEPSIDAFALACRLFGAGEIAKPEAEHERFDALARLGIDLRAGNAVVAASFAEARPSFGSAVSVIAARAEWFDGTGKPNGLRSTAIPVGASLLAAAIAYDALDRSERLEDAAGTQFDPRIVRAMIETAKANA
jgi:response regulator RpfG family c-di-GMP phosphodiesterase